MELLTPYWAQLDLVTIVGTAMGTKGASMDSSVPEKVRRARQIISDRGLKVEIEVDGGIDSQTGPQTVAAGADVLGASLECEDVVQRRAELALDAEDPDVLLHRLLELAVQRERILAVLT